MLNEQVEDKRTIFQILDDIKKQHQEWKTSFQEKECNLCEENDKCWFHTNPGDKYNARN